MMALQSITVTTTSGDIRGPFEIPVEETVALLKARIDLPQGVISQLVFDDLVLPDEATLTACRVPDGANLTVVLSSLESTGLCGKWARTENRSVPGDEGPATTKTYEV